MALKVKTNATKKKSSTPKVESISQSKEKPSYNIREIKNGWLVRKSWSDDKGYHDEEVYHKDNPVEIKELMDADGADE